MPTFKPQVLLPNDVFTTLKAALNHKVVTQPMAQAIAADLGLNKATGDPRTAITLFVPTADVSCVCCVCCV